MACAPPAPAAPPATVSSAHGGVSGGCVNRRRQSPFSLRTPRRLCHAVRRAFFCFLLKPSEKGLRRPLARRHGEFKPRQARRRARVAWRLRARVSPVTGQWCSASRSRPDGWRAARSTCVAGRARLACWPTGRNIGPWSNIVFSSQNSCTKMDEWRNVPGR
jgi:hypothetical protein